MYAGSWSCPGRRRTPKWGDSGYLAVERAAEESGLDWTHVRPGEFAGNWRDWAPAIRTRRLVRRPYGDAVTQPTHEADIAAVIAATLTGDGHAGRTYTFAGPEALTIAEQVRLIGVALGQEVGFEEHDPEQAREQWIQDGYPAGFVDWMFGIWAESAREPAPVNERWAAVVPHLTGRPARTFGQWATPRPSVSRAGGRGGRFVRPGHGWVSATSCGSYGRTASGPPSPSGRG